MNAKTQILNWTMMISLILVFISGVLLKPLPGMWMGITHGVSGIVLFVSAMIHILGHMGIRRRAKVKVKG
ncbi:MAG: hypothetical protein IJO60_10040 [Agathobacter sp.]|nr:hypothetical protein [Agathobacter sp.]